MIIENVEALTAESILDQDVFYELFSIKDEFFRKTKTIELLTQADELGVRVEFAKAFSEYEETLKTTIRRETKNKNGRKIVEEINENDLDMPTLEEFEQRDKNWLVPGWIPEGCVTLLCSDGGIGKTSVWCDTLAAFTSGSPTIFDKALGIPFKTGEKYDVMYFSKEDPTEEILLGKIERANADLSKIRCFGLDDKRMEKIWYGSLLLEKLIEKYRPAICVFDTLQAFLPEGTDMAKRKDMRDALNPLSALGAKYGTSFLLIMHTNKSSNSGRQRMADSSDIWDIGRSAIMAGRTKDGKICYMSHEKCNYGELQKTILFTVGDDGLEYKGTSKKKDADFMADRATVTVATPKISEAKQFILDQLKESDGNKIEVGKLVEIAKAAGLKEHTLENARAELREEGEIVLKNEGIGNSKKWFLILQLKKNGE